MNKDSKTDGETKEQPPMEKVCDFLFRNGGKVDSVKFSKEFGLEPDFSLGYMNILVDMNKYPLEIDRDNKTISLSPYGERIFRIAELIVGRFRDDMGKLADAVLRFMICGVLSDRDRKQKGWSIDIYNNYCINIVYTFLDDEEKSKSIRIC